MPKFIEVHNTIINIEEVSRVDFLSDDVYLGLFPVEKGEPVIDYLPFTFARLHLFSGDVIDLEVHLYWLEDREDEEAWLQKNRYYIHSSWGALIDALGSITKITDFEYMD